MTSLLQLSDDAITAAIRELMERDRIRRWVRGCLSKARYRSEKKAERSITRIRRKRRVSLHAYYCEQCAGWHLTKRPPE